MKTKRREVRTLKFKNLRSYGFTRQVVLSKWDQGQVADDLLIGVAADEEVGGPRPTLMNGRTSQNIRMLCGEPHPPVGASPCTMKHGTGGSILTEEAEQ